MASMESFKIHRDRVAVHQVYEGRKDGACKDPKKGPECIEFGEGALEMLEKRVVDALGQHSKKSARMKIVNQGCNGLPYLIDKLVDKGNDELPASSYNLARKLTKAQKSKNIPAGLIIVFTGTQGPHSGKFLGIIKAEMHEGLEKQENKEGEMSIQLSKDLFLTPAARLYKVAGFFEKSDSPGDKAPSDLNDKWEVVVSDHQMSSSNGSEVAKFFYADFLGCSYSDTDARMTKQFYKLTSEFIQKSNLPPSKKNDLRAALYAYLKVSTENFISASDFSSEYFSKAANPDSYLEFMKEKGVGNSFPKNLKDIENNLKYRKIHFLESKIKIKAPSDTFAKLVTIETIPGDPDGSGAPSRWTKIIVKESEYEEE